LSWLTRFGAGALVAFGGEPLDLGRGNDQHARADAPRLQPPREDEPAHVSGVIPQRGCRLPDCVLAYSHGGIIRDTAHNSNATRRSRYLRVTALLIGTKPIGQPGRSDAGPARAARARSSCGAAASAADADAHAGRCATWRRAAAPPPVTTQ